jgi:hypothetical protein
MGKSDGAVYRDERLGLCQELSYPQMSLRDILRCGAAAWVVSETALVPPSPSCCGLPRTPPLT